MKKVLFLSFLFLISIVAAQPVVQNGEFDIIAKASGSPCACSQWINSDLGAAADGFGIGGDNAISRFDRAKTGQVLYQEVEVEPNTDYRFSYRVQTDWNEGPRGDIQPTGEQAIIRILKGSRFRGDYVPPASYTYEFPQDRPTRDFGFNMLSDVQIGSNNITTAIYNAPTATNKADFEAWETPEIIFNSGSESVIAIFAMDNATTTPVGDIRWDYFRLEEVNLASVKDVFASDLQIYPNPANTILTVKSVGAISIDSVEIFNILGARVFNDKLDNGQIDVSHLDAGMYMLRANGNNSSSTRRIIIE